jgi:HSP20 family protein
MFSLVPWKRRDTNTSVMTRDDPLFRFRRDFDELFDRLWRGWATPFEAGPTYGWGLDVHDAGNEFVVRAEAPGFEANEFDVRVLGDVLTISAEHREEAKEGEQVAEQRWGTYQRSVTLPVGVDAEKVEARYRNGVLEIHLPKTPEAQGRRIEVKT